MTDEQPDLDTAFQRFGEQLAEALKPAAEAIRNAWTVAKPAIEMLARSAETRAAALEAIGAAYDEDDDGINAALAGLDSEQLSEIQEAANLLAREASHAGYVRRAYS